jgi:hypothetical protein
VLDRESIREAERRWPPSNGREGRVSFLELLMGARAYHPLQLIDSFTPGPWLNVMHRRAAEWEEIVSIRHALPDVVSGDVVRAEFKQQLLAAGMSDKRVDAVLGAIQFGAAVRISGADTPPGTEKGRQN